MPIKLDIPDCFFKKNPTGGYSTTGPGDHLDIQRLVRGEPAWWSNATPQHNSPAGATKPKVLILIDDISSGSHMVRTPFMDYKLKKNSETLRELFMQGFIIKYCNNNMMVDLTLDDIAPLAHSVWIKSRDKEYIATAMSALKIASEDYIFLDDHKLRQLRTGDSLYETLAKHGMSLMELDVGSHNVQKFFSQEFAISKECESLILAPHSCLSKRESYSLPKFLSLLSGSKVRHLRLSKVTFDKQGAADTTPALPNIKYFHIEFPYNCEDSSMLLRLLSSMTRLEDLYIKQAPIVPLPQLSYLRAFNLVNSRGESFDLCFLQHTPKLASIKLEKATIVIKPIQALSLPALKYVQLHYCKFQDAKSVFVLCKNAVKLEVSNISLENSMGDGLENFGSLSSLRFLNITISSKDDILILDILIQKSVNLKSFTLRLSEGFALKDSFYRLNLSNIENIFIAHYKLSNENAQITFNPIDVAHLYYNAPKIQNLNIWHCLLQMGTGEDFIKDRDFIEQMAKESKLAEGARTKIHMRNCVVDLGFLYYLGDLMADYSCVNLTVNDNEMIETEFSCIPGAIKGCIVLTLNTLRAISTKLLQENSLVHLKKLNLTNIFNASTTSIAECIAWLKKIVIAAPNIEIIKLPELPVLKKKIEESFAQNLVFQGKLEYIRNPQAAPNGRNHHSTRDIYGGGGGAKKDPHETVATTDLAFNLKKHFNQKPPEAFDRANHPHPDDKNQTMVIYKLSIYLLEISNRPDLVADIQGGICITLTYLFAATSKNDLDKIIEKICDWNGCMDTLDRELLEYFELIINLIDLRKKNPAQRLYCGVQIKGEIHSIKDNTSIIITNPWHAIAINCNEGKFYFYDPNIPGMVAIEYDDIDKLFELLHKQLGPLLSVARHGKNAMLPGCITDLNEFLSSGGFILLYQNKSLLKYCSAKHLQHTYSEEALRGLLIFIADGDPAWLMGMRQPLSREFFMQIIKIYIDTSQENIKSLERSLQYLDEDIKNLGLKIIAELSNVSPNISAIDSAMSSYSDIKNVAKSSATAAPNNSGRSGLFGASRESLAARLESEILQEFKQAKQEIRTFANQADWMKALFTAKSKNNLVITHSASAELVSTTAIYEAMIIGGFQVYLAKEPRDLFCNHPTIVCGTDGVGIYRQGSVGALYDFLTSLDAKSPAFILVYGKKFNKTAPFNSMFDDTPTMDGLALPGNIRIIWVKDASDLRNSLKSDFISRFGKTFNYHFSETTPQATAISAEQMAEATVINLHGSSNWQGILDGSPIINGAEIRFTPSALNDARAKGKPIVIANGPYDDPTFRLYIAQLTIDNARHADGAINIMHATFPFVFSDFSRRVSFRNIEATILFASHDFHLLNLNTFSSMFSEAVLSADGLLTMQDGVLNKFQGKTLQLLLTSTLLEKNWAQLLTKACALEVRLEIHVLPNVNIPGKFEPDVTAAAPADVAGGGGAAAKVEIDVDVDLSQHFICSDDIGFSVAKFLHVSEGFRDAIVLDVSGLDQQHLLEKIELAPGFSIKDGNLLFTREEQYFLDCLKNHPEMKFILHGKFSSGLLDALLPILKLYAGRFVLMSDDANQFMKFATDKVNILYLDKLDLLSKILGQDVSLDLNKTDAEKFNLSYHELLALELHQQRNPENTDCRAPWRSFMQLAIPTTLHTVVIKSNEEHKLAADEYMAARVQMIHEALASSPFVTILGLTGVGKSSLMREAFEYETDILTWAKNKSGRFLFIDEATIANNDDSALSKYKWNMFAGMHATPPYVVIAGRKMDITEKHKVIFAGNPLNYAGRELAELFIKYPNHIVFEPLSIDIVYDRILSPILSKLDEESMKIAVEQILTAYNLFIKHATDTVLITARHLKTIAMLTLKDSEDDPELDIGFIVKNNINLVLSNIVPDAARPEFAALFSVACWYNSTYKILDKHIVAPSRQKLYQYCQSILELRVFMQKHDESLNVAQKKGGLGCIIIEGGPGLGKTEMLRALMHANGLQEKDLSAASVASEEDNGQKYCCIPASLSSEMKNNLYLKAYRNGWVVIADEFNSDEIPEQLLNSILDGCADADCKPGFLLFITQNPVILGQRVAISPALLNRANYNDVNDYAPKEIAVILQNLGADESRAKALAGAFSKFNSEHPDDPMTFRALMPMMPPTPDLEQTSAAAPSLSHRI